MSVHVDVPHPWVFDPAGVKVWPDRGDVVAVLYADVRGELSFHVVRVDVVLPDGRLVVDGLATVDFCRGCVGVLFKQAEALCRGRLASSPSRVIGWVRVHPLAQEVGA